MFTFQTIKRKTVVLIFITFALFLSIDTIYQFSKTKSRLFNTLDKTNTTLNTLIVEYTSAYVYNNDIENLQRTVDVIKSDFVKSIYILDKDANIIVQSNKPISSKIKKHPKFDELLKREHRVIKNAQEYFILNTFDILDVPIGYMILEADLEIHNNHVYNELTRHMLSALLWLIIFFVLSLFIAKSLTTPIHDIIEKLGFIKDNEVLEFSHQSQKEFQFLSSTIARTHNRLRSSNENLESKVKEKTAELQALNISLENRVKEEVEKNHKKDQQMLQQSRLAQMGEMISMIAHQWRQPLSAISATAVNLEMKIVLESFDLDTKDGQKEANEYFYSKLKDIGRYVQNLTTTIDDFRNFYKPNKESVQTTFEEITNKSLAIIKASLESDNIEIVYNYNSTEIVELYDTEMIQVVLNILKNSQDNFKEKKTLNPCITITTDDRSLSVCDNGGGISEDILDNIFDPYFSTKNEKNGSGLGLYMSKTIVEEHHKGSLSATSIDRGVCFTIELRKLK